MERYEIVYHMSADASIDGIAVHEVADVMYAFAEAVDEAMKLCGETDRLTVNVKPFKEGSFITEFVVSYAQQGLALFSSQEANALCNVLGMLGFMGFGINVPTIVRKVAGRIDKCRKNDDGTWSYGDIDPVTVDDKMHEVIQSPKVAKAMKTVCIGPLINLDKSINVTVCSKEEFEASDRTAGSHFDSADVPDMLSYEHIAVEGVPEEHEDILTTMHRIPISPVSGPYDGGENGYSFRYLDSKWPRVQIHDAEFRMQLESGEVRLMNRDLLIVDLDVVQTITKSGKESVKRTITKVLEYRPYRTQRQMTLDEVTAKDE